MNDDPFASLPPERVELRRSPPPRESVLPPRAVPGLLGVVGAGLTGAIATANQIGDPRWRAGAFLACVFVAWLIGYVTPPPRRTFRRDDRGRP